jgi:hypothetical protein
MLLAGFKPASEQLQTHTLDCAATGRIGRQNMLTENMVDGYASKNSDAAL